MKNVTQQIICESALPRSSESDGQRSDGQPLPDLIAVDQYVRTLSALHGRNRRGGPRSAWACLRTAVAVPPGAA